MQNIVEKKIPEGESDVVLAAIDKINEKLSFPACPICSGTAWSAVNKPIHPASFEGEGALHGTGLPMVLIGCVQCGFVYLFLINQLLKMGDSEGGE